jgi:hypothetical protein
MGVVVVLFCQASSGWVLGGGEDQKLSSGIKVEETRRRDSDLVFHQSSACLRDPGAVEDFAQHV